MRITIACPVAMMDDANQLAAALGFSMADAETFRGNGWQDSVGNLYAAASGEVSEAWLTIAQEPLTRPAWDTDDQIDMVAAERAQAVAVVLVEPALATNTNLTVFEWPSGPEALALMGIVPVESFHEEAV